ncbi:MAG TPA: winged helix-turn-helix domain-containing protein, partial [Candidatus Eisenbacteria bacterium]|nr:winged helix-turn-helix domain-containing protein [Candidatus Eisenbacteria bacterium]
DLRALAHPLRLRLVEAFAHAERTAMQVAAQLGEPPTRLYHHVRVLERAGILELVRTRQVRGTTEKYYRLGRKSLGVSQDARPGRATSARLGRVAALVLDQARQDLLAAVANPGAHASGGKPMALRMLVSAPASRIERVRRRLIAALRAIHKDCARAPGAARSAADANWALTIAFAPRSGSARAEK